MRSSHPEDRWRSATLEQIADLRLWLLQRITERHADAVGRWVLAINAGERPRLPRRQLGAVRHLVGRYGPPRNISVREG